MTISILKSLVCSTAFAVKQEDGYTFYTDSLIVYPSSTKVSTPSTSLYLAIGILFIIIICALIFLVRKSFRKGTTISSPTGNECAEDTLITEMDKLAQNQQRLFMQYMANTPIHKEIVLLIEQNKKDVCTQELLSEEKWNELFIAINKVTDNFTARLQQEFTSLKTEDIRFCCLVKSGFKYSDIAHVMGRTSNMMYKRSELIVQRMNLANGKQKLKEYIQNY